jgi:hypothetical protein
MTEHSAISGQVSAVSQSSIINRQLGSSQRRGRVEGVLFELDGDGQAGCSIRSALLGVVIPYKGILIRNLRIDTAREMHQQTATRSYMRYPHLM